jgi:hypothetical protein
LDVARLVGVFCTVPAEIRALDPAAKSSRLAVNGHELEAPYLPGRLKGDRVCIYIHPHALRATPRTATQRPNQLPATLERVLETPSGARLEFAEGYWVAVDRDEIPAGDPVREWWVEFPAAKIRVV